MTTPMNLLKPTCKLEPKSLLGTTYPYFSFSVKISAVELVSISESCSCLQILSKRATGDLKLRKVGDILPVF